MRRIFLFIITIFTLVVSGCSSTSEFSYDYTNSVEAQEINLFENLEITDISFKRDDFGWIRVMGKIKNNNNVPVIGYLEIVFYDEDENILDTNLVSLPAGGIPPNNVATFSEVSTTKEIFHSYEFFDSAIMENF